RIIDEELELEVVGEIRHGEALDHISAVADSIFDRARVTARGWHETKLHRVRTARKRNRREQGLCRESVKRFAEGLGRLLHARQGSEEAVLANEITKQSADSLRGVQHEPHELMTRRHRKRGMVDEQEILFRGVARCRKRARSVLPKDFQRQAL